MVKKKVVAGIMAFVMFTMNIPQNVQAMVLDTPTKLEIVEIKHKPNDSGSDIEPSVAIKWEAPLIEEPDVSVGSSSKNFGYRVGIAEVEDNGAIGEFVYTNFLGRDTFSLQLDTTEFKYRYSGGNFVPTDAFELENGSKYEITVIYTQRNTDTNEDTGQTTVSEFFADNSPTKTIITDFNPLVETAPEGLLISWEYVPGIDYEIGYMPGVKLDASEITGDLATIITLTKEQVQNTYYNPDTDRVEYLITVDLAEQYSVYVKPDKNVIDQGIESNQVYEELKVSIGLKGIELTVEDMDGTNIQIDWTGQIANTLIEQLDRVEIYKSVTPEEQGALAKAKEAPITEQYFILERPDVITYYTVRFTFVTESGETLVVQTKITYNPAQRVKPPTPTIPNPFSPTINEDYLLENEKEFLVTDDHTQINLEDIESFQERTFHTYMDGEDVYIQLVWDLPEEIRDMAGKGYEVGYDLWVSDSPIPEGTEPDEQMMYGQDLNEYITYPEGEPVGFKKQLTMNGGPFEKNKTYYIQLRAKNIYGEEDIQYSDTVQVSITIDKDGHIFVPPVIGNPPLGIKNDDQNVPMITESEIMIEWPTEWVEVYAKAALAQYQDETLFGDLERDYARYGNAQIYLPEQDEEPMIRFREDDAYPRDILMVGDGQKAFDIQALIEDINKLYADETEFDDEYGYRSIFLDEGIGYEIAVLPYAQAEQMAEALLGEKNIEEFVSSIRPEAVINAELDWQTIMPVEGRDDIWLEHQITGLQPSTEYLILFRAYRETDTEILKQLFPSYVIGTTLSDFETDEPIPTVPTINVKEDSETDTSFVVYWEYDKNFDYELVYNLLSDVGGATEIIMDKDENLRFVERNGKVYAEVTLYGLFPETNYYVWVKAKQQTGDQESAWSNPAIGTTKEVQAPDVPTGLGPASQYSILELDQDFEPLGDDYITVEWNRDRNDLGLGEQGTITRTYEYDLEIGEDISFEGARMITVTDGLGATETAEVIAKNMAKFIGLKPNTYYYFRIRSRVILSDSASGKEIQKESEYSTWVRISTTTTNDEYDGGENDNIVTYPGITEESFEDGIWEVEILDAQTVISEIVESKDYFYTIDMDLYNDRYDAQIRRVEMPISVLQALIGQRMELKVNTHRASYQIPAEALSYMLNNVASTDIIQFNFKTMLGYDLTHIAKEYPYEVHTSEQLGIKVNSERAGIKEVKQFDGMIRVRLKLEDPSAYYVDPFKAYTYNQTNGQWIGETYTIEATNEETYMSYSTPYLGIYTLYKIDSVAQSKNLNYAMQEMIDRYNISGFGVTYKVNDSVKANEYMQIMLGVAQDYVDISLGSEISDQAKKMAQITGIYVDTEEVTQEQAVHGLVRLYEMETGHRVKASGQAFPGVSAQYQESVSKAYAIGLISEINAKETITYGIFSEWLMTAVR